MHAKSKNQSNHRPSARGVLKKKKAVKDKRIRVYAAFWVLLVALFICVMVMQFGKYRKYDSEQAMLLAEIEKETKIRDELQKELRFNNSDVYIEKLARERLGLVRQDEIVFFNDEKK